MVFLHLLLPEGVVCAITVIFKSTSTTPSTSAFPPRKQKWGFVVIFKKYIITVQEASLFSVNRNLISLSLTRSRWGRQGIEIGKEKVKESS